MPHYVSDIFLLLLVSSSLILDFIYFFRFVAEMTASFKNYIF
jgi:hypothetical protein